MGLRVPLGMLFALASLTGCARPALRVAPTTPALALQFPSWSAPLVASTQELVRALPPAAPPAPRRTYAWTQGRSARYAIETTQSVEQPQATVTVRSLLRVDTLRARADGSAEQRVRLDVLPSDRRTQRAVRDGLLPGLSFGGEALVERDSYGSVLARSGHEGVANTAQFMLPAFPPEGVAVGAQWQTERDYALALGRGMDFRFEAQSTWRLRSAEQTPAGELLVVGLAMRLRLSERSSVGGMPVEADGEAAGEITLAPSRGIVVASTLRGSVVLRARGNPDTLTLPVRFSEEVRFAGEGG